MVIFQYFPLVSSMQARNFNSCLNVTVDFWHDMGQ